MNKCALILVCGLPGCGKSTTAEAIARELHLPIFSVDPIESGILRSGIARSFETGLAAYMIAEILASEHFKLGQSVIVDAVSGVMEAKQQWRDLAVRFDAQLVIIECICSDKMVQRQRLAVRKRDIYGIPEISWSNVEKYAAEYVEWTEPKLVLDAMNASESNSQKAIAYARQFL